MSILSVAPAVVNAAPDDASPPHIEGTPAESAAGAWDGDEREEWAAAELRDEMAQRGYW